MSFKSFRLIFLLITVQNLIALGLANSEQCFYVYVCCQRHPETYACLEYCPPSFECGNHLVESNDDNLTENGHLRTTTEETGSTIEDLASTTEEITAKTQESATTEESAPKDPEDPVDNKLGPAEGQFQKGKDTAVIDTKLCRIGMRLVSGRCKRVF